LISETDFSVDEEITTDVRKLKNKMYEFFDALPIEIGRASCRERV